MAELNFKEIAPARVEAPRDQWGRPLVVPKAGGKPIAHQRTTTFIDVLSDKSNLVDWGKRMVLVGASGAATTPRIAELLRVAASINQEEPGAKRSLDRIVESLLEASGANVKRERGTYLHGLSELVDQGLPLPDTISEEDLADMMAYMSAMVTMTPTHIERLVAVNALGVAGTPDRVVYYDGPGPDGKPFKANIITDLKTGSVAYDPLKIAMQLAVYSRGEFYNYGAFPVDLQDKPALKAWKSREFTAEEAAVAYEPFEVDQKWGLVVNLIAGSGEATLHWADLELGWEAVQLAVQVRAIRKRGSKALSAALTNR